jgi:coproporphyrinogen III oxidase-like Fe-S oxidoreductase
MSSGYRLRPWRSPYLRWRIETYSGIHAEAIGFRGFWRFSWQQRRELARYLRWAAGMAGGGAAYRKQQDSSPIQRSASPESAK